jgi:hypothetical protein
VQVPNLFSIAQNNEDYIDATTIAADCSEGHFAKEWTAVEP